ncbi:hypothetical protein [Neorhodopirellula pilleata]|uniref:Uncharacterized protein n=1 Tax=Neorhodopirellula pilleata TaxID=2714738 RepID=A0A5C5ZZG3_9BACT|nr:hypothetical protein [Neorhodopirellula pilleata]TWT92954.1 hypothetical protein Pla100_42700 [Neorhodopirellula pilleata]
MQTPPSTGKVSRRRARKTIARRQLEKNQRREFLIETLERRDHPGALAEASGLTLLATSAHQTPSPVRDLVKFAIDRLPNRSLPHAIEPIQAASLDTAEGPQSNQAAETTSTESTTGQNDPPNTQVNPDESDPGPSSFNDQSSDPPPGKHPHFNPLTSAVSQSDVYADLDAEPQTDPATADKDELPFIMPTPIGDPVGHGGQLLTVTDVADAQGTVMGSSPTTQREGGLPNNSESLPPDNSTSSTDSASAPGNEPASTPNASTDSNSSEPTVPPAQSAVNQDHPENEVDHDSVDISHAPPGTGPSDFIGPLLMQTSAVEVDFESTPDHLLDEPNSITVCCCNEESLSQWATNEFGGSPTGRGEVSLGTNELVASEGDSLLIEISQPVTIPANPSTLSFSFEVHFDTTAQQQINDAFEVALLGADGFSVVPTIDLQRDSYFNLTESVGSRQGISTTFESDSETTMPPDSRAETYAGTVQLDISQLAGLNDLTLVMRLVNNDADSGSWFRLTCDTALASGVDDQFTIFEDTPLSISTPTERFDTYRRPASQSAAFFSVDSVRSVPAMNGLH